MLPQDEPYVAAGYTAARPSSPERKILRAGAGVDQDLAQFYRHRRGRACPSRNGLRSVVGARSGSEAPKGLCLSCFAILCGRTQFAPTASHCGTGKPVPLISKMRSISPPWRGAPMPVKRALGRGGLPNGAFSSHRLATIKQGRLSDFQNAKRRGSAERQRS